MAAIAALAATSYSTPSNQVWNSRARLDQARREADQAEANAKQLRTQADQAERDAQQSQTRVRAASAQVDQVAQSNTTYSAPLRQQPGALNPRPLNQPSTSGRLVDLTA
jgi:septal ring factor EnvC (AmiA/AmiB activator)